MNEGDRDLWMTLRQALLNQVDAIERRLGITPRTADLRRLQKSQECDTIRQHEIRST